MFHLRVMNTSDNYSKEAFRGNALSWLYVRETTITVTGLTTQLNLTFAKCPNRFVARACSHFWTNELHPRWRLLNPLQEAIRVLKPGGGTAL